MSTDNTGYRQYEFRTQPWFDQAKFDGFNQAIPMKTIVIHCFDPRAADIPQAVAAHFGDEVYPGENILDEAGNRVGHTRTLFAVANAGGRALAALQSVATMDYLFNRVEKVVVVHHSFCGATSFTPEILVDSFQEHHHADIAPLFEHDVALLRASPAVPKSVKLYGFFYEMNTGKLVELARDIPA